MTVRACLRRRALALAVVFCAQGLLALLWAFVLALPVLRAVRQHPDGVFALYADGGRLALEVAARVEPAASPLALATGALMVLYAHGWLVLGGLLPSLFTSMERVSLVRAAGWSVQRTPAWLALGSMALGGYAVCGLWGYLAWPYAEARLTAGAAPSPLALLWLFPPALLAWVVTAWHDLARVQLAGDGGSSLTAASGALTRLARAPWAVLSRVLGYQLLGLGGMALAFGASTLWGGRRAAAAVVALALVQGLAVLGRFLARVSLLAELATPWRRPAAEGTPGNRR
ncbi:MAG: hypothetical protein HY909_24495 [Deltaproteobacteria bacterium]|nr:hypothetical protein [Deltaproteobacteria bacterium]